MRAELSDGAQPAPAAGALLVPGKQAGSPSGSALSLAPLHTTTALQPANAAGSVANWYTSPVTTSNSGTDAAKEAAAAAAAVLVALAAADTDAAPDAAEGGGSRFAARARSRTSARHGTPFARSACTTRLRGWLSVGCFF